jgi:phosphatidylinositol glycan class B
MRPGLQPFIAYCGMLLAKTLGISDPFVHAILLRLFAGVLAFWVYWKWMETLAPTLSDNGRLLKLSFVFFWMMPYINVRFSSENMSAITFFAGLLLLYPKPSEKLPWKFIGAGALFCLSFFFRYQAAFAGLGLVAWLFFREKLSFKNWLLLALGALIALIPCLGLDYWLYGKWVFAPYNYFTQNIVEGKASGFGVSPWYWYFTEMPIFFLPPVSLFLFWFMGVGIKKVPNHVFVWCLIFFVLGHSLVAHKETRFMFPMVFPMFYLAALGRDQYFAERKMPRWLTIAWKVTLVVNVIALIYRCVYPANDSFTFIRYMRSYAARHPEASIYWEKPGKTKKEKLIPHFYQTPWMKVVVLDSLPEMNDRSLHQPKAGDLIFFRKENYNFVPEGFQTERVYQWYPKWLLKLNFNNWVERTRVSSVYQIR